MGNDMTSKLKAKAPELILAGKIKANIFGKSGSGKSWLATSFPAIYYVDTESGATQPQYIERLKNGGGAYFGVEDGALDFEEIISQVQALATERHQYRTLVIDSITKVFINCITKEQERLGSKDGFGLSKKPAINYMRRLSSWISRLDMNVWLISHETTEWGLVNGERQEIGVKPDIHEKIIYDLDLTLQVRAHTNKRRDAIVYKSRLLSFPQGDQIVLQDNGKDMCYEEIANRYGRDAIEADSKPILVATDQQVAQISKLFTVLQYKDEQISKILAKANVDSIDELETESATNLINHLKKKTEI